ncbi:Hypothetical predicted protein [Podarcis lilfordi]|uniref:Uncharacterized protein n=1 Tax=Podarcis lilfordi TaxID=74358 RepID=A0AA35PPZ8_9SAUR|nr:Hypothetical predicted protein [Podarcis lilfordi]
MKCVLLFALLLLLRLLPWGKTQIAVPTPNKDARPLSETNGSTCAKWLYGTVPPQVEAFQCAGQPDGAEVKFCCGTCDQTRNCSFEELAEGSPARPTDGKREPCPPVQYWLLVTVFCVGVLATVIFYWGFYRPCRKFWLTETVTFEVPEEIEGETGSSVKPRETYTRLDQLLPVGALGPPSLHDGPASTSSDAPSEQPPAPPSNAPSEQPPAPPSNAPSEQPPAPPSNAPSEQPPAPPSNAPSVKPPAPPSNAPSVKPPAPPSNAPSVKPPAPPSNAPSVKPPAPPSNAPSVKPPAPPSNAPSVKPPAPPSNAPSVQPPALPSNAPSVQPPARMPGNVAVVWFSTGLVPIRMETPPPQRNRGRRRPLTRPEN